VRLHTERYGGMLCATWLDRPLSVAGRIVVRENGRIVSKLVNIDRDLLLIPNVAIHMMRNANDGMSYNANVDLFPLFGDTADRGRFRALIAETAKELKVANPADVAKRAAQLENELKETKRELESANAKLSSAKLAAIIDKATQVGAYKLLTARLDMKVDAARTLCDSIRADHPAMVAVFALVNDGKLNFIACCGADAVKAGAHAGNILRSVSAICGGKGGGRPDSAMSGGSDLSKIEEALASVAGLLA
jgi:aspartyl aminopeptidase